MNRLICLCIVVSGLIFSDSYAQTGALPFDPSVRKGTLSNGLTYYIRKNSKPVERAELRLAVNVGSIQEAPDQRGIAHFLEHMAFNGTKNFPRNELLNYLEGTGVRFGADLNATTNFDHTIYMLPIPVSDPTVLDNGLKVLRDWAGNLLLDSLEIEKERGIILEEKRMRQNAFMRTYAAYIPKLTNNSLYGQRIPIGLEEIIKTAPRSTFKKFYDSWYQPKNMAVIVVGDIDVDAMEKKIRQLFGDLRQDTTAPQRPSLTPIVWHKQHQSLVVTDSELTNNVLYMYFGMKQKPAIENQATFREKLLTNLLDLLFDDRLSQIVATPTSPVSYAGISSKEDFLRGYETISAVALPKNDAGEAINILVATLLRAKKFGFTKEEIDRAKKNMEKEMEEAFLEKNTTESRLLADRLVGHFLDHLPQPGIEAERNATQEFLRTVTHDQLMKQLNTIQLDKPAFILYTTNGQEKVRISDAELLATYRKALLQNVEVVKEEKLKGDLVENPPVPGSLKKKSSDTELGTTTLEYANGIRVIYKKTNFKNDEVVFRAFQWGGLSNYSENDFILAKYLNMLSGLGVGSHRSSDMPRLLNGVNTLVFMNLQPVNFSMSGAGSAVDLEKLVQLIYLKLTKLNFNDEDFQAVRSNYLTQTSGMFNNPQLRFRDSLYRYRYSNSKRLTGLPKSEDSIAVTLSAMKSLYDRMSSNWNGLSFYFVGNIDEAKFEKLAEQYLGGIVTAPIIQEVKKDLIPMSISGNNEFVIRGGKENKSDISYSYYGRAEGLSDQEILSFSLLSEILQMQATRKLREEMASTYSPQVSASYLRPPTGEFSVSLNVTSLPAATGPIIKAFDGLVKQIVDGQLSDEDFQKAKLQRIKSTEPLLMSNSYWAYLLDQQGSYQISPALTAQYLRFIENISKDDVLKVAGRLLKDANRLSGIMDPNNP